MDTQEQRQKHPVTPIVSRVEDSHRRIQRDIQALGKLEHPRDIGAIADELVELLKEHFEDEEKAGGLFDELEALCPTVDSQLKFLRGEHREIMQALEDLRGQVREAQEVHLKAQFPQRADRIRTSAAAFVQLIHHHERIESRLVADTYYSDEGGRG
jgi:anion-transporting  ArsA/GET3 family ATPase